MPFDSSIPLQVQAPSLDMALKPISSLLSIRQQQQQLQLGQQAMQSNQQSLQSNQIDVQEKQAMQQVLSDPSQYTDGQGNVDWNKLTPTVMKVAPVNGPKYIQGLFAAQQQATAAKQAVQSLDTDSRAQVAKFVTSQVGQPPDKIAQAVSSLKQSFPTLAPAVDHALQVMAPVLQSGNQSDIDATVMRLGKSIEQPLTQQTMNTPEGVAVGNGQQTQVISTKSGTSVPIGQPIPGTTQQQQLPPTTPTVGPNNQPGYLGAVPAPMRNNNPGALMPGGKLAQYPTMEAGLQALDANLSAYGKQGVNTLAGVISKWAPSSGQNDTAAYISDVSRRLGIAPNQPIDLSNPLVRHALATGIIIHENGAGSLGGQGQTAQRGFVPSGPVPGANESKANTVDTANQHWKSLNDAATNAPLIQGLIGNIKALAPGAITGTDAGKKAYVTGLLNAMRLGNKATGDMQTDTDLLEKNIAQLGLNTPATTDAARTLVAAARPHSTMSQEAIVEAAAQLQGQVQANLAIRNALTTPKAVMDRTGDATAYNQTRAHLEQIADPRAWQFQALDPQGRKNMLSKLTPEDRAQLRSNIQQLEQEGLLK